MVTPNLTEQRILRWQNENGDVNFRPSNMYDGDERRTTNDNNRRSKFAKVRDHHTHIHHMTQISMNEIDVDLLFVRFFEHVRTGIHNSAPKNERRNVLNGILLHP
jgi:hypothetical protein